MLALLLLLSAQVHLQGTLSAEGGDYLLLPFEVPAGTVEFQVAHSDLSDENILDWGLWGPEGWRGWGGGLTDDAIVGVDESSRGYSTGPIPPGTWNIVIGKAKILASPAQYVVDVTMRTQPTLAVRARTTVPGRVLAQESRWYSGDLHVHSEESGDAHATLPQIATLARQRHLDFVALSDHNTVTQHSLAAAFSHTEYLEHRRDLLIMRSAEVTTYKGHGGALGAAAYIDHRVGLNGRGATDILADVHAAGGIFIINHPVLDLGNACIGCAWTHADTPWEQVDAMEIHTGPYQPVATLFTPQAIALWDAKLDEGQHITAVGGSDDHEAGMDTGNFAAILGSPTTRVRAAQLDEANILAAVKQGAVQVALRGPEDPWVDLLVTSDLGMGSIGDRISGNRVKVEVRVTGGAGFQVGLFRNGRLVDARNIASANVTESWSFPTSAMGDRWRVHVMDGELNVVVTNHVWVDWAEPYSPALGAGCDSLSVTGDGVPAAMVLLLAAAWRIRRRPPAA
jgi:hypothetical protein